MDSGYLDFPLQAVAHKSQKTVFRCDLGEVYYEKAGSHFVVAGDPVAFKGSKELVFEEFEKWVASKSGRVCGYYFSEDFSPKNFEKVYAGSSSIIDLQKCSLAGKDNKEIRRAMNQAHRFGLEFVEMTSPVSDELKNEFNKTYDEWLKSKRAPVIHFLLSPPNFEHGGRFFAVYQKNSKRPSAFVSVYKYRNGYYLDDMIQRPGGHRFAMDFLISRLLFLLKAEGAEKISLGFNAFDGIKGKDFLTRLMVVAGKMSWPYNSSGVRSFKKKFNGNMMGRFILFDRRHSRVRQIIAMISVTYRQSPGIKE